jgi:hypothetical protein
MSENSLSAYVVLDRGHGEIKDLTNWTIAKLNPIVAKKCHEKRSKKLAVAYGLWFYNDYLQIIEPIQEATASEVQQITNHGKIP